MIFKTYLINNFSDGRLKLVVVIATTLVDFIAGILLIVGTLMVNLQF